MSEQNNAAAERSAHITRGAAPTIKEDVLTEVSKGVFQLKAVVDANRERDEAHWLHAVAMADLENAGEMQRELIEENNRLRAALKKIAHSGDYDSIVSPDGARHEIAIQTALDALEGDA